MSESVSEMQIALADRIKHHRLQKNLTQSELATRSGLSLASYRRFEKTGEISLKSLPSTHTRYVGGGTVGATNDF